MARLPRLLPQEYRDFISLEAGARSARTVELSVVPGLLQTPEYARAVTRAALGGLPEPKVDALVDVRLARQAVLRADPPLELSAVLDEAVLRRQIGGPGVMAEQLRHLVRVAGLPQVRLQVLPFSVGGISASPDRSSFSHLRTLPIWMWWYSTI